MKRYIGIGTTSPQGLLHINNESALSVPWINVTDGGDGAKFIIDTAGNVGIGTTGPLSKLHVRGADGWSILFDQRSSYLTNSDNAVISISDGTGSSPYEVAGNLIIQPRTSTASRHIVFATGSTTPSERVRITDTGNVGIGTHA